MKTILVSIDFSAVSKRVVDEAVDLARSVNGQLVVLHVVQPPVLTDSDFGTQLSSEYATLASQSAEKQLAKLKQQLKAEGCVVETRTASGYPGQVIVDEAEAVAADYIVLGSHGHGAFYDLIVGSTATRVLKQASCPVVIVPPKPKRRTRKPAKTKKR